MACYIVAFCFVLIHIVSGGLLISAYPVLTRRPLIFLKGHYMRIKLTSAFIASAKAEPRAERSIYWDESLPSFGLQVTATGAKSFVCQYRAGRRSRRLSIKARLSLSEARKEAKAILGRVAKGHDPLSERRKQEAAATNTLQSTCEAYFKREGKKLRTMSERERTLARLVDPRLGARQIDDIRRSEIVRLLDHIEDTSGAVMADRTLAYLRRVMSWHAGRSDDFRSPIVRGMARTKPSERARERILSDDEFRKVWAAAENTGNTFGPLVRFILATAARKSEAAHMLRSEVVDDIWTVPARRSKGKRDHDVPLSPLAQSILAAVPVINESDRVFTHDGRTFIGNFSKAKKKLDKASGVVGWTLHDLRRSSRSLLSRAGVDSNVAERCIGHAVGGVKGVYDRFGYADEKRQAFAALASLIERILDPKKNVVSLRARS
jgi:integrase